MQDGSRTHRGDSGPAGKRGRGRRIAGSRKTTRRNGALVGVGGHRTAQNVTTGQRLPAARGIASPPILALVVFGGLFFGFCQAVIPASKRGPWVSFNRYFRLVCAFTPA